MCYESRMKRETWRRPGPFHSSGDACCKYSMPPACSKAVAAGNVVAGIRQHFGTLWDVWTEGQGWCWYEPLSHSSLKQNLTQGSSLENIFLLPSQDINNRWKSHALQKERETRVTPGVIQYAVVIQELPPGGLAIQILFSLCRCSLMVCAHSVN